MEFYFVDYENVNTSGLNGITRLTDEDMVIIFYSEKANTLTFGLHRRLNECKAEIRFQRIIAGTKNALDFQLSSYLGYLICENTGKNARFYIVSADQGYRVLSDYWKRQQVEVRLVRDISQRAGDRPSAPSGAGKAPGASAPAAPVSSVSAVPVPSAPAAIPDGGELERRLEALLPDRGMVSTVAEAVRDSRTQQDVYLKLWASYRETLDDEGFRRLYQAIRPLISSLPSPLEAKLESLLPGPEMAGRVAKIIRTQKTKDGVRLALIQTYRQAGEGLAPGEAYSTASRVYEAIRPLLIGKPNAGEEPSAAEEEVSGVEGTPDTGRPEDDTLEERLAALLPDRSRVAAVAEILRRSGSRQEVSGELNRKFRPSPGDKSVSVIYRAIQPLIADLPGAPPESGGTPNTSLENQLRGLLPDRSMVPAVAGIIRSCKTRTEINAALMRAYPSPNNQTAGELYRTIRPLLSGKK